MAGIGGGMYYGAANIDWGSLPIIGQNDGKSTAEAGQATPTPGAGATAAPSQPLARFESACKDSNGRDCRTAFDIISVSSAGSGGIAVRYQLRVTGQQGCSARIAADKDVLAAEQTAGKPGIYLEGGQGRLYLLLRSDGFLASGGTSACDASQSGAWTFAAATGEQSLKLRYPGLPPVRFDMTNPPAARNLPADDAINVIPAESTNCVTVDNQPCKATWEIGPYGFAGDGAPIVYFALRYQGPANCKVDWVSDLEFHKAAVGRGEPGIRLEIVGGVDPLLAAAGGVASSTGPLPCGVVHYGFWKFTPGDLPQAVNLIYPDLPPVRIPIKP
jgi:hypothetical protein